tara:strand:- start:202 stop:4500 length:4299 start_codon:yes stop_codon:yes gene_type:complete
MRFFAIFATVLLSLTCLGGTSFAEGGYSHKRIVFTNITEGQGLTAGRIRSIVEDRRGFIWLASESGLARYDGFEVQPYLGSSGLQWSNDLQVLAEDVAGWFWIGTRKNGLIRFHPDSGRMAQFRSQPGNSATLSHNSVTCIQQDGDRFIWVGTESGLNRLDRKTAAFERMLLGPNQGREFVTDIAFTDGPKGRNIWVGTKGSGLYRQQVENTWEQIWNPTVECTSIAVGRDESGAFIWMGTIGGGIYRISGAGKVVDQINPGDDPAFGLNGSDILSLKVDSKGDLWAGTPSGLCRFDHKHREWTFYNHKHHDSSSVVRGAVETIFEDRGNVLWVGTSTGEISQHNLDRLWFPHYIADPADKESLSHNSVWGISEGADGKVWVGTEEGLNLFDPKTETFSRELKDSSGSKILPEDYIYCVLVDGKGRIWLGTRGGGLLRKDPGQHDFRAYRRNIRKPGSLPGDSVSTLFEDHAGQIWVGVLGSGLLRFSEESESFEAVKNGDELRFVNQLHQDDDGRIWAASVGRGLWYYDRETDEMRSYFELPGISAEIPFENIYAIATDQDGSVWLGAVDGGLCRFNPKEDEVRVFSRRTAQQDAWNVFGLVFDDRGKLWISSGSGLSTYDAEEDKFRHFTIQDGLQGLGFHPKAILKASDGSLYFGGVNGFNRIFPSRLPAPQDPPLPLLIGLELNGERVEVSENGPLRKPLAAMFDEPLRLGFDRERHLAFRFGTLDYSAASSSQFEYRLENFDSAWQPAGDMRKARYPKLQPGEYQFRVRVSPDGQSWQEMRQALRVIISPPWYQTVWAIVLFVVAGMMAIGGGGAVLYRIRSAQEVAQREMLANERNRAEAALSRQLQQSMLLERTSAEFRRSLDGTQVFESALRALGEDFNVSRCLVATFSTEDPSKLEVLAEYLAPETPSLRHLEVVASHPLAFQVLNSGHAVAIESADPKGNIADSSRQVIGFDARSTLAVRTAHLESANGMIILQQCDAMRYWEEDESKLLLSVAGQVGIAIAQFKLSQKEARQARELSDARRAADEANQAKSDFLAKMTHELRTPLNAIIGFSEVMTSEEDLNARQRENLEIINSSGEHLLGVINDVLEVSKIEAGKAELLLERVDLEVLLKSVHGMLSVNAKAKSIGLQLEATSTLPKWIEGDKGKLRQILINLLSNAVKFTSEGSVVLRVGAHYPSTEPQESNRYPFILSVEVIDSGEGISEEELPNLFQKFVQTKSGKSSSQGTGLGLAIVKGFTELMGGAVRVASKVGQGTNFALQIPMIQVADLGEGEEANEKGEVISLAPGHPEVRVLVAEDQPLNRLLMRKFLLSAGFTLAEAEDGKIAVEKWREWRPHVIFMDEEMPNMRGTEATRAIAAEAGSEMPVIVSLTAFALEDQRIAAMEAGCVDFVAKPFKRHELFEVIAKHLPVRYLYSNEQSVAA